MVDGLAQERERLGGFSFVQCDPAPICCGIPSVRATNSAPLWGLRLSSRLMHDGASVEIGDAIRRHQKEAEEISERFSKLAPAIKRRCWRFSNRFERLQTSDSSLF